MARPLKGGIDYFPLDVGFLGDKKVKMVKGVFGAKGILVMIALLSEIYRGDGYYKQWDEDDCVLMSEDVSCGVSPDLVAQVVQECLKRSFFDEGVFERFHILTSHGIQKRYVRACENRDEIRFITEYYLLDTNDKDDVPPRLVKKLSFKTVSGAGNDIKPAGNPEESSDNAPKEKEKESKVNEKETPPRAKAAKKPRKTVLTPVELERFERFWSVWPHRTSRGQAEATWKKLDPDDQLTDDIIAGVHRSIQSDHRFRVIGRFTPHPSTWLNAAGWKDEFEQQAGNSGYDDSWT